jgi:hypothetical protein
MPRNSHLQLLLLLLISGAAAFGGEKNVSKPPSSRFEISFPQEMSAMPLDGHILLLISNNNEREPRFQVSFMVQYSQQVFGVDVDGLAPGASAVIDSSTLG